MYEESKLKIGENSYITLENADAYIDAMYHKYSPLRVVWSVLDAEEKDRYMFESMRELETMPVIGTRTVIGQKLQFPRRKTELPVVPFFPFAFFIAAGAEGIPDEVRGAQIENALGIIDKECSARANIQFQSLQTLGAMKNVKYSKREVSDAVLGGLGEGTADKKTRYLTSAKAERLMRGWLGSYGG
jgi:hypothetical protein